MDRNGQLSVLEEDALGIDRQLSVQTEVGILIDSCLP
jgi:hypothetical protein